MTKIGIKDCWSYHDEIPLIKLLFLSYFFCSSLLMADLPKLTIRGALHMLRLFLLSDKFFLIFLTFHSVVCKYTLHAKHIIMISVKCNVEMSATCFRGTCIVFSSRTIHMYVISLCTYKLPYGYLWTLSIKVHRMIVHM